MIYIKLYSKYENRDVILLNISVYFLCLKHLIVHEKNCNSIISFKLNIFIIYIYIIMWF